MQCSVASPSRAAWDVEGHGVRGHGKGGGGRPARGRSQREGLGMDGGESGESESLVGVYKHAHPHHVPLHAPDAGRGEGLPERGK